jgi:hypothetical protein
MHCQLWTNFSSHLTHSFTSFSLHTTANRRLSLTIRFNSTQLNSAQLNSTQLNSTQLNSTQLNSTQLNSTHLNSANSLILTVPRTLQRFCTGEVILETCRWLLTDFGSFKNHLQGGATIFSKDPRSHVLPSSRSHDNNRYNLFKM